MHRENQQEIKITELDIAWLAGLFNGDGCFAMNVRKKCWKGKRSIGVDLSITLTQTDAIIVEKAVRLAELITGVTPYVVEQKPSGSGTHNKMNMRISRMAHIKPFIETLLPYMVGGKAAKARLMLKYVTNRLSKMGDSVKEKNPRLCKEDWGLVVDFHGLTHKNTQMMPEVLEILRG